MQSVNTSELTGFALDWAVATCEGYTPHHYMKALNIVKDAHGNVTGIQVPIQRKYVWYTPSVNWAQGGPIIEREMIQLTPHCMVNPLHGWAAAYRSFDEDDSVYALHRMRGKTPLIAAMRCYVASKLGDNLEVPTELLNV